MTVYLGGVSRCLLVSHFLVWAAIGLLAFPTIVPASFRREGRRILGYSQLDDVGVSEQLQVSNFPLDPAGHVPVDQFPPRNDLQGDLLAGDLVHGELDLAERALTERLDNGVLPHASLRVPSLEADILTRVWILAEGVVDVGMVGGGLGVLGVLGLLWLWLLLLVVLGLGLGLLLLRGGRRNPVRIVGAVLATVSRNGELDLRVGLRHGGGSIGAGGGDIGGRVVISGAAILGNSSNIGTGQVSGGREAGEAGWLLCRERGSSRGWAAR